jgi:hypothetical protein
MLISEQLSNYSHPLCFLLLWLPKHDTFKYSKTAFLVPLTIVSPTFTINTNPLIHSRHQTSPSPINQHHIPRTVSPGFASHEEDTARHVFFGTDPLERYLGACEFTVAY